ncbi:MAG: hypothetical protein E2O39_10125 [Planctomycetota bacterium]|nr:MAG: hypothetical protein E2O39_10125 [Planctomycetota bacterium]
MQRFIIGLGATALLYATASAQNFTETFTNASNEGDWEVYWDAVNTFESTGGNPDWYLRLDNSMAGTTCQWVLIRQRVWPSAFSGDWRAADVTSVGLDVNLVVGPSMVNPEWVITLANDSGTPADDTDDCRLIYHATQLPPSQSGWQSFDFPVPADSLTLPLNWEVEGPCSLVDWTITWNQVIQDVDYVTFRLDTDNLVFCNFTNVWDLGVDNVRVSGGLGTTNYCIATANSAGSPATISASGSTSVASNVMTLSAEPVPNQPAVFFYGPEQTQMPFGNGFLCVGTGSTGIARLAVENGVGNVVTHALDMTMPTTPQTQITAGSTWNFQCWYRDPAAGGAFFNLSDGLEITFTP